MNNFTGSGAMSALKLGNVSIKFVRTCRVPAAKGLENNLPANLGTFDIFPVAKYADRVPADWKPEGHFICMHIHEAMYMGFNVTPGAVVAMLVAAGKINAVTGEILEPILQTNPQNYIVAPPQPWLDGWKTGKTGAVRQFIAAQAGSGETVEEQLTGKFEFGGIQIGVFNPIINLIPETTPIENIIGGGFKPKYKPPYFPHPEPEHTFPEHERYALKSLSSRSITYGASATRSIGSNLEKRTMGLGGGGVIKQKVYPDNYIEGLSVEEVWHKKPAHKAFIYIIDPIGFTQITGLDAPKSPITFETYQKQNLPWFGLPDGTWDDTEGSEILDKIKPIGENKTPFMKKDKIEAGTDKLW